MQTELFMYFCIKKYIKTQGEVCRQLKILYPPPPSLQVVYAIDRSKAVWSRCCLILCGFVVDTTGRFMI